MDPRANRPSEAPRPGEAAHPELAAASATGPRSSADPSLGADAAPLILLVEDNPTNQRTVHIFLQAKGYRVVLAVNGIEAVERAAEFKPALILMDVQMPQMDGLEAMRRLRSQTEFAATPIIALTALAMPGDRERCLEAGANVYLSKPVSLKELAAVVGRLVNLAGS